MYIYYKCILVLTFTPYFYYKSHWKLHTVHVLCVIISTFNVASKDFSEILYTRTNPAKYITLCSGVKMIPLNPCISELQVRLTLTLQQQGIKHV